MCDQGCHRGFTFPPLTAMAITIDPSIVVNAKQRALSEPVPSRSFVRSFVRFKRLKSSPSIYTYTFVCHESLYEAVSLYEGTGSRISAPRSTTLHLPRSSERNQVFLHDKHNLFLSLSLFLYLSFFFYFYFARFEISGSFFFSFCSLLLLLPKMNGFLDGRVSFLCVVLICQFRRNIVVCLHRFDFSGLDFKRFCL